MSGDVAGVCHTGGCGVVAEPTERSTGSVAQRVVGGCVHASAYGPEVCERGFYGALESYYGALSSYISNVAGPCVSGPVGSGGDACLVGDKDGLLLPVWHGPTWNNGLRSGCDDARLERAEIGVSGLPSSVAFNRRFLDGGVEAITSENLRNRGFVEGTLVEHSPSSCVGGAVGSVGKNSAARSGGEPAKLDRSDVGGCGLKSVGCEKEAGSLGSRVVETKTERNRRWRKEKKELKRRRQVAQLGRAVQSKDWNADKLVKNHFGFFSSCPVDVQIELRQTRAELLIAKNKKDRIEVERKTKELTSDVKMVADVLKLVKMQGEVEKIQKTATDKRVCGWVKTVVSGASESAIDSAIKSSPSLPSLGSVDVSDSVSQTVSDDKLKLRNAEYKLALAALDKEVEDSLWVNNDDYLVAKDKIKDEYADVAYTSEERYKKDLLESIFKALGTSFTMPMLERLADAGIVPQDSVCYY